MRSHRRTLIFCWLAIPAGLLLVFLLGPRHPVTLLAFAVGIFLEMKVLAAVRGRVPAIREYMRERSVARALMLAYGFVLSALAVWLLTAGQKYGSRLEEFLPAIFLVIVGLIAVAFIAYHRHVYRALGDDGA